MGEIKNPFSFGTGDIDKDLWLRDIDNELEDFITRYGSATNKHRTALLRQAFQDLRTRIANGDMLNRTADGLYQFGSALIRDDKHMQEAYQRALGFMGDLARRQLSTPAPEPEKKKITGSTIEDEFKKSLGPDGRFNEKAYWARTPEARGQGLMQFLTGFKNRLNDYLDFSSFTDRAGLESRLDAAIKALNDKKYDDWSLSLLGLTSDWINKPTEEVVEKPKTEDEILDLQLADIQAEEERKRKRALIERSNNRGITTLSFGSYPKYDLKSAFEKYLYPNGAPQFNFSSLSVPWQPDLSARRQVSDSDITAFRAGEMVDLDRYFDNFGLNYRNLYNLNANNLAYMLSRLTATGGDVDSNGNPMPEFANSLNRYLTPIGGGNYIINGSKNNNGRFAIYTPLGILELNIEDLPEEVKETYNNYLHLYKDGGSILKLQDGGVTDAARSFYGVQTINNKSTLNTPAQKPKQQEEVYIPEGMDAGDWITLVGTTAADIGSMLSANAVGYGTALSAGLGVGSTLGSAINEFRHGNVGAGFTNIGLGLPADLVGLIPGLGSGAKGWKIGRTLMKFSRPLMAAFSASNLADANRVMLKMAKEGAGSLTYEDWTTLGAALTSMVTRGKAAHTRLRNVEFMNKATKNSNLKKEGRSQITEEGLVKTGKEFLDEKRLGLNIPSRKFTEPVWKSVPAEGSINAPFYARPWSEIINTGKGKKKAQFGEWEKDFKSRGSIVEEEKYGGILKALRNGGIIKAELGWNTTNWDWTSNNNKNEIQVPLDPNTPYSNLRQTINFGNATPTFFIDLNITKNKLDANRGQVLAGSREKYSVPYSGNLTLLNYKSAMDALLNYYKSDYGRNIMGDVYNYYNIWKLSNPNGDYTSFINNYNDHVRSIRDWHFKKFELDSNGNPVHKVNETGWERFNQEHNSLYPSYGEYDKNKEQWLGESTWRRLPNSFDDDNDMKDFRNGFLKEGDNSSYIHMKNDGTLELVEAPKQNTNGVKEGQNKKQQAVVDSAGETKTLMELKLKDPFDPTLLTIAGKTLLGLRGNRDIYGNLLKEMPQAPLRDPIDRKLAIVGWQEQIKQGQNQLADLRNIYGKLVGSDALVNLAGALEVEGKGRDIMNDKFMKDSERLFTTALRSWDLDNDDYLRNNEIYYLNDKARKDRARMMAQIRAAWRSGDNNILMGGLADTSNWLLKRYQREQDVIDRARGIELGTPESRMQERLVTELGDLANKKPSEMTAAEIAKVEATKAKILRESNKTYASDYYNMFHTPGFGGGYYTTIAKDGTKLEIAKLKARGKDNDRYVSMIKDLRQSSRRRRRR